MANQYIVKPWSQSEISIVRNLMHDGYTAYRISRVMKDRSPDSITGLAARMGMKFMKAAHFNLWKSNATANVSKRHPLNHPEFKAEAAGPNSIPLLKLLDHHCRWPHEELFCGEKITQGSYCTKHYKLSRESHV